jgi:hypothetical protein
VLTVVICAGFALPALAGCGGAKADSATKAASGTGGAQAAADPSATVQKSIDMRRREEDMIAACMRKSGFTYQPYVPDMILHPLKQEPSDYEGIKAYRSKYGFGSLFGSIVYKGDRNVVQYAPDPDPNRAMRAQLDPAQQAAYDMAYQGPPDRTKRSAPREGCVGEAVRAVDPVARKREEVVAKIHNSRDVPCDAVCAAEKAGENKVKPLEAEYASCLKGLGVPMNVGGATLTDLSFKVVQQRFDAANQAIPGKGELPKIDIEVARAELNKEIKVALDDLECGKKYIPAANKAREDAWALSPPTGGL